MPKGVHPKNTGPRPWRVKGDIYTYSGWHTRLRRELGKPSFCSWCGIEDLTVEYHWACTNPYLEASPGQFISDKFEDYIRLCVKCHLHFDDLVGTGGRDKHAALRQ